MVVYFSHMQNFSQFKGGAWPKWPNGKYAYDRVDTEPLSFSKLNTTQIGTFLSLG